MDASPLVKILLVFGGVLLLTRFKLHLGIALLLGGLSLQLWTGRTLPHVLASLGDALATAELWLLLVITALIFEYGRHMAEERNAQAIMGAARAWGGRHGRTLGLMAIPAAIGLVPMPGGALFSAPLVDQTAPESHWSPTWKATVNYWFRHTWEYWWPLFPVVIVSVSIFDIGIGPFILIQMPLSLAVLVSGYWVLIRPHLAELAQPPAQSATEPNRIWRVALPLSIVVICTLIGPRVIGWIHPAPGQQTRTLLAMIIGLFIGLIPLLRDSGAGATRAFLTRLTEPKALSLLATIAGVILFKNLLDASELLPLAGEQLLRSGIPPVLIIIVLPLVAGLVTGIAIGFAGIAFPLLAGLVSGTEGSPGIAATLVLGFACGYAGMMWSPIHLCFVLTRGYFGAPIAPVLRGVIRCSILPLLVAGLMYFLLAYTGW